MLSGKVHSNLVEADRTDIRVRSCPQIVEDVTCYRREPWLGIHDSLGDGEACQFGDTAQAQFVHQAVSVELHCLGRDAE